MAPSFTVPPGASASVRIIDTTTYLTLPVDIFMNPPIPGFDYMNRMPSWSFLIEHPSGRKLLFDMGVRKDWENLSPAVVDVLKKMKWGIEVEKNAIEVLEEGGVKGEEIEAIIWSHWHWDHLGDPSTFPPLTNLIVGPGFKESLLPAYPANDKAAVLDTDFANRKLIELAQSDFPLKIGRFQASDYFGDGSFYILSTPGHAVGHISGLARTSTNPDTFIMMGGDLCHHSGELRPSTHLPLPAEISPNPLFSKGAARSPIPCPGSLFEAVQQSRSRSVTQPFFEPTMGLDIPEVIRTIEKAQEADADENVLFIFAHDDTFDGVIDFYPKHVNDWKEKGVAKKVKWAFLKDFEYAAKEIEASKAC